MLFAVIANRSIATRICPGASDAGASPTNAALVMSSRSMSIAQSFCMRTLSIVLPAAAGWGIPIQMPRSHTIAVKRIYEAADAGDGARFLVDRLWPRGVSKDKAALTAWLKPLSPSDAMREEFHHATANSDRSEEHTSELQSLMRISY